MVSFHSAPVMFSSLTTRSTILLFAYALASIFYIFNTISLIKNSDNKVKIDVITAAINGMFLLTWVLSAGKEEWQSIIILTWMLVFLVGAFLIFYNTQKKIPLYIYTGVATMMLAAATTIELDGAVLTIAYTIESAIISLLMLQTINITKSYKNWTQ
jgi:predicted neutral ceramidase superfamily lipid hydrolase